MCIRLHMGDKDPVKDATLLYNGVSSNVSNFLNKPTTEQAQIAAEYATKPETYGNLIGGLAFGGGKIFATGAAASSWSVQAKLFNALNGITRKSTTVGNLIRKGKLGVNVLSDNAFAKYIDALAKKRGYTIDPDANAVYMPGTSQIYLRASRMVDDFDEFVSDALHEGVHNLDDKSLFRYSYSQDIMGWEKRAYMAEDAFKAAQGKPTVFKSVEDLEKMILENYIGQ